MCGTKNRPQSTDENVGKADLSEKEGPGGVAEDWAYHVQQAGVNASLGMGLSMPIR